MMTDLFWQAENRKRWPKIDSSKIFLGWAVISVGEIMFADNWTGAQERPSEEQFFEIQREIASTASSGSLKSFVFDEKTSEFVEINRKYWRNERSYSARFSRCQADPHDFTNKIAISGNSGAIFLEKAEFFEFMNLLAVSYGVSGSQQLFGDRWISNLLAFQIHYAQKFPLSPHELPRKKTLVGDLQREWIIWREKVPNAGEQRMVPELSDRIADAMASILRGEDALTLRLPRRRK